VNRRILLLIKGLGSGGAEQLLVSAIRHADRSRFDYDVAYLLPQKNALVQPLRELGIEATCLDGSSGLGWVHRLQGLVRRLGCSIVHVHSPNPAAFARLAVPRDVHIVYTEHNVWQRYHRATYWANLLTYPRNEYVLAVSDHVRDSVRYPRGMRRRRMPPIETLYHGPEPDALAFAPSSNGVRREFGIPEGVPLVGTVANFKGHKGYQYLLQAAAIVRASIPEVRFIFVGQGPLEDEKKRQAQAMGLNGTVIFAGYRQDVLRVVSAIDLFVLPSLYEGLSIALIEAMALGKPAVVTGVGGLPEVVEDGKQGLLVPAADPVSLAHGIMTLIRDEGARARMGRAAVPRSKVFDIRKAVRRIEHVYEELLV
jgi:glycosyltransferase involved in cell wall biosynthesis